MGGDASVISEDVPASVEVGEGVPDAPPRVEPSPSERALEAIAEARRQVEDEKAAWLIAKEKAADAKKSYDAAVDGLLRVIRHHTEGVKALPLFDKPGPEPAPDEPAGWRETPLSGLGLSDGILKALAEHAPPILTLGHLTDFTNGRDNQLTDIKGIGEAKAEEIREVSLAFWEARREADGGIPEDVRHLAPAAEPARAEAPAEA